MGTPNTDRVRLAKELAEILSHPIYRQALDKGNEYGSMQHRNQQLRAMAANKSLKMPPYVPKGPAEFAQDAVNAAFGPMDRPNLVDPVLVLELIPRNSEVCLYRSYDGISHKTALTLGRWWCNRRLIKQICHATSQYSGEFRQRKILEFMRSAMFVHPKWNYGTDVARMSIPQGGRVPVIVGKGSWQSLTSSPEIQTEEDAMEKLGMVPIPGPKQFFVPLVNDMWIRSVPKLSQNWPLD